jgi:hypothetical protein
LHCDIGVPRCSPRLAGCRSGISASSDAGTASPRDAFPERLRGGNRAEREYLVVPIEDAKRLKKSSDGLAPGRLNDLGAEGWEAVGLSLKQRDLVAWPVVLLKRPLA